MSITEALRGYLADNAAKFYQGFTDEALLDYVMFHMQQQTLAFVHLNQEVVGVMIGWQQQESEPVPFHWQPHDPTGGYWYWDMFVASTPEAALALADAFRRTWPDSDKLPAVATRNTVVRHYKPGHLSRLLTKGQRYGWRTSSKN
jgi:hypothetical protein